MTACTVVSIEDDKLDRERRSDAFDAHSYVDQIWHAKVLPRFGQSAPEIGEILVAADKDLGAAGAKYGRQAGEGSPWTFAVRGEGVVSAIDVTARAGTVTIAVDTPVGSRPVQLATGPVVTGSAIRDSQDFIAFNDFTNQIAYAKVSKEMNDKALAATRGNLTALKVGDRVRFAGAFALSSPKAVVRILPVVVQTVP